MPAFLFECRYFFLHDKHSLSFKLPTQQATTTYAPLGALLLVSQPFVSFCTFFYFVPLRFTSFFKVAKFQLSHIFIGLVPVVAAASGIFFCSVPLRFTVF